MATTLGTIVDDLIVSFRQINDDKNIQKSQVAHWVIMFGNRLRSQHIGKRDSQAYLSVFAGLEIKEFTSIKNPNEVPGRKYFELPSSIYDYDEDGGIEYISYYMAEQKATCPPPFTTQTFNRTTQSTSKRLYMSKYEKPSPENPYFYRVGDLIYLLGLECVQPDYVEIGVYSTLKPITDSEVDMNMIFDFPEELLIQLQKSVLDLGRFVMMMPEERVNDGAETRQGSVPTNKLVSVNEGNEDAVNNK